MPETCVLWWTTNLTSSADRPHIPTNFPTKKLEVRIDRSNCGGAIALFDYSWNPGREIEIRLATWSAESSSLAFRMVNGTNSTTVGTITGTNAREVLFKFDPVSNQWRACISSLTASVDGSAFTPDGERLAPTGPVTVEEWLELHPEWASP